MLINIIIFRTCQCSNFWGGSACDVCLDKKKCLTEPKLLMLLPQSGPILKQNTFVFAHGTDFPKADSYRYSCIFGGIATEGRWLSSNLIRCMVPPVSHVGKHLFNLIPLNSNIKIQYLENRPVCKLFKDKFFFNLIYRFIILFMLIVIPIFAKAVAWDQNVFVVMIEMVFNVKI